LPESGRRRKRHGVVPASLGAARFCRGGGVSWAAHRTPANTRAGGQVRAACERELWDGEWYIRGITAKGVKIGTRESEEGKIFHREQHLGRGFRCRLRRARPAPRWTPWTGISTPRTAFTCLWPAFSKPNDDIGFVARVYKGIKENAAIFSHPNPWAVIAECKLGRGERAMKFYDALLPSNQNDQIEFARPSRIPTASS
jgi:N,N'-diacetylchitobiose phosphorylase